MVKSRIPTTDEKIAEMADHIAAQARELFMGHFDDRSQPIEEWTPIEQLMGVGLLTAMRDYGFYGDCGDNNFAERSSYTTYETTDFAWAVEFGILIFPQMPIGKYRADFLVSVRHYEGGEVIGVIECDGHDFHERSKEQARHDKQRDRYFQSLGLIVLRYTGSEIFRDPLMCAAGALGILHQRARALKRGKK